LRLFSFPIQKEIHDIPMDNTRAHFVTPMLELPQAFTWALAFVEK
jgi:hypothetical protein